MKTLEASPTKLPSLAGQEDAIQNAIRNRPASCYRDESDVNFGTIRSACAIALHMHQPLIPAGGDDLQTAEIISNLKYMMDHQDIGDNHNAPVFHWCYKRIGEIIPKLVAEGKSPRVMLDYSGTLFYGLVQMGLTDVIDALRPITVDPQYRRCAEWLGTPWGHAVAPSTPIQDYRLHVTAWQHHFAELFGHEALARVKGFSPSEMALPNHPDVAYEFVKTLVDCGFQWVLIQEHTVEQTENAWGPQRPHLPHRLICKNSRGQTASMIAIVKTQGSDTKLVAQMQPYFEAKGLSHQELGGHSIPPIVTQIADGENGGVMMNEFPPKFEEVVREASGSETPLMNVSEYLEHLFHAGVKESDLPTVQPIHQKKIWDRMQDGAGADELEKTIQSIKKEDPQFHMDGGSWTNNLSWVQGYDNVLGPMEEASALFYEKALKPSPERADHRFNNALFHLLSSQTSCYRYWGQGQWTDYGREICRRTTDILNYDF